MLELLKIDQSISRRFLLPEDKIFLRKFAAFLAHSGDSWFLEIGLFLIWIFMLGNMKEQNVAFFKAGRGLVKPILNRPI